MIKPNKDLLTPDEFVLDKKDVSFVLKSVAKHWNRDNFNILENGAYTGVMVLIQTALKANSNKVLQEIYFSIVQGVNEIQLLNGLKLHSLENPKLLDLYEKEIEKIENGEAFVK